MNERTQVKKKEKSKPHNGTKEVGTKLNPYATVPKTIRFPEDVAYQMDFYAARMNISVGRMLIAIMQDVLPAFEAEETSSSHPTMIRQVVIYRTMKKGQVLSEVDSEELIERIKLASNRKKSALATE